MSTGINTSATFDVHVIPNPTTGDSFQKPGNEARSPHQTLGPMRRSPTDRKRAAGVPAGLEREGELGLGSDALPGAFADESDHFPPSFAERADSQIYRVDTLENRSPFVVDRDPMRAEYDARLDPRFGTYPNPSTDGVNDSFPALGTNATQPRVARL